MTTRILNLGAGVQSTTIALMGVANWEYWHCSEPLPYPLVGLIDWAIFADTQDEPSAVYDHLEWLEVQTSKWFPILCRTAGKLSEAAVNKGAGIIGPGFKRAGNVRFISLPFFLKDELTGVVSMAHRHCTTEFKIDVIREVIKKELKLNLSEIQQIFGLSYDEAGRVAKVKASVPQTVFPLFEMEMTRGSCKTWLRKHFPEREVPRSACVYCPFHTNAEWRNIRTNPEDWARAVELDRRLREGFFVSNCGLTNTAYIHRDCVPLDQVDLDDPEVKERKKGQEMFGFLQECQGMCGV